MTRSSPLDGRLAAINNPAQAWHLSRLAAVREVLEAFPSLPHADANADELAKVNAFLEHLRACANQAWLGYVGLVAFNAAERNAYLELGEPDHIRLNLEEGTPVAHWNANNPSLSGAFGELLVESEEAPSYHVSDPFKPVDLAALPEGTFKAPLRDSRHTAIAAMHELVTLLHRDTLRMQSSSAPPAAWKAMRQHAQFLKTSARISLSYLQHDHYENWDPMLPPATSFQESPVVVDKKAATTTAQQRIALHYCAQCYGAVLEEVESQSSGDTEARVRGVTDRLQAATEDLAAALAVMNKGVLSTADIDPATVVPVVIFRPVDQLQPMLVAIPREAVKPPTSIPR